MANKLYQEFGDWHFHRFWRQLLEQNPAILKGKISQLKIPKEYLAFLSVPTINILLCSRGIFLLARQLRGEKQPLDEQFYLMKEKEEYQEFLIEKRKINLNWRQFNIEKAIILTNNKIVNRCLKNFEGDLEPKRHEKH
ncbi:MAG: hypothetical protein ABH896_03515 [Candidatus Jacksonbacteria bacterium]